MKCASYGHSSKECNCRSVNSVIEWNIPVTKEKPIIQTFEILNHPKTIRSFLKMFDDLPKKEIRDKDKYKKHLKDFQKRRNIKVILYNIVE